MNIVNQYLIIIIIFKYIYIYFNHFYILFGLEIDSGSLIYNTKSEKSNNSTQNQNHCSRKSSANIGSTKTATTTTKSILRNSSSTSSNIETTFPVTLSRGLTVIQSCPSTIKTIKQDDDYSSIDSLFLSDLSANSESHTLSSSSESYCQSDCSLYSLEHHQNFDKKNNFFKKNQRSVDQLYEYNNNINRMNKKMKNKNKTKTESNKKGKLFHFFFKFKINKF
jgi:hypothetical protein